MLLSLLITNYNHAGFLEELVASIVNQTYNSWEIVFVDDYSSDQSMEEFERLCEVRSLTERLVARCHKKNRGYGQALKTAAEAASGDFFCIVDADDALELIALEEISKFLSKNSDCEFLYSQYRVMDANSKITRQCGTSKPLPKGHTALSYYQATKRAVISHLKVFSKKAYFASAQFDPQIKKAVDQDIVFKLEEVTKPHFLNKKLYRYRVHKDQITKRLIGNLTGRQWHNKVASMAQQRRASKGGKT